MRDADHYKGVIIEKDTVGRQLLAKAIYAHRHGDADLASKDDLRDIMRGLDETTSSDDALELLEAVAQGERPGWREALERLDPPPGWAIRELRDAAGGPEALADALNTSARTVRRWVAGDRQPRGPAVAAMRMLAERVDGGDQ